jgi:uncharacterized integral membrane protein (TIGR00698 family)
MKSEAPASTASANDSNILAPVIKYAPGIAVAVIVALSAKFLEQQGFGPALVIALILGLLMSSVIGTGTAAPGVDFAGKHILALGVAFLGARLTLNDITSLGVTPALVMVTAMAATLATSWICARALGLDRHIAVVAGCATAVCGASAAVAAASVMPKKAGSETDTALIIIAVTVVSALALIVYPPIVASLHLPAAESGVILGGSIHNVPQAVAAGYTLSDAAGNAATLTKLFRVALLGPIVVGIAFAFGTRGQGTGPKLGVPWFIIAFAVLIVIGSIVAIPPALKHAMNSASSWFLLIAIAGIGLKTSLPALRKVGPRVLVLILANSATIIAILAAAAFAGLI